MYVCMYVCVKKTKANTYTYVIHFQYVIHFHCLNKFELILYDPFRLFRFKFYTREDVGQYEDLNKTASGCREVFFFGH